MSEWHPMDAQTPEAMQAWMAAHGGKPVRLGPPDRGGATMSELTAEVDAVRSSVDRGERVERRRADNAVAAAAEIGGVLDVIERNLRATKYETIHEATTDLLDLIRVARESARACYGADMPQLVTVMTALRKAEAERDEALTKLASLTHQRDVVGRELLDALQARDEARGLLGEVRDDADDMDMDDKLRARIAAHLGAK